MATVQENSPAFMLWCVEGDGKDGRANTPKHMAANLGAMC